jgi:hypothetical protein
VGLKRELILNYWMRFFPDNMFFRLVAQLGVGGHVILEDNGFDLYVKAARVLWIGEGVNGILKGVVIPRYKGEYKRG